jgi:hypothetical protein
MEKSLSISSLANHVQRGSKLPYWAPAGQIFAMDNCSGLYLSTGNDMKDVPGQQIEHYTWMPVEQSPSFTHTIGFTFNRPVSDFTHPVGPHDLREEHTRHGASGLWVRQNAGSTTRVPRSAGPQRRDGSFALTRGLLHERLQISVTIDPNLNSILVGWYGDEVMINHYISGRGPAVVKSTKVSPGSPVPVVTVANLPSPSTAPTTLCRSLTQSH